jgi:MerR family transcriptional regulator, heat shock protein HspR
MSSQPNDEHDHAIYVISVAAELAGVHPQTLRIYERKGLLQPERTAGNTRRYSQHDIDILKRIQELTTQGLNLAGVMRVMELEVELARLEARHEQTMQHLEEIEDRLSEVVSARDQVALVPLRDIRRIRRAMKSEVLERAGRRRVFVVAPPESTD